MPDLRSVVAPVVAVVLTVGFAWSIGFGPFASGDVEDAPPPAGGETYEDLLAEATARNPQPPQPPAPVEDDRLPLPPAVDGVRTLYDDLWTVEEGQWSLGAAMDDFDADGPPSFTSLFEAVGREGAYLVVPGFYGRYRVVVELTDEAPPVPRWCEDAAEVSMRIAGDLPAFTMGSFESFSDPVAVPAGTYRVRYCAEKQDEAAQQEEFTGDEYTVYAGRHLLQLWQAERAPDRVLRAGSRFARDL